MLFTTAATALLTLTLVSAAPLNPRTASTIVNDLQLVSSDTITLQGDIDSIAATTTAEIEFELAMDNLNGAIKDMITDTNKNTLFDVTDSARLDMKMDLFSPTLVTALKTLAAMTADFAAAGLTATALADVQLIQSDMDTFYEDLLVLMDASDIADIQGLQVTLDSQFKKTIADLS